VGGCYPPGESKSSRRRGKCYWCIKRYEGALYINRQRCTWSYVLFLLADGFWIIHRQLFIGLNIWLQQLACRGRRGAKYIIHGKVCCGCTTKRPNNGAIVISFFHCSVPGSALPVWVGAAWGCVFIKHKMYIF